MRGLLLVLASMLAVPSWAAHAYAQFGDVKYPPGFRHFDYVNPQAPKGGGVRLVALGTFDNFNQAIAGLKGLFAAAAGTIMCLSTASTTRWRWSKRCTARTGAWDGRVRAPAAAVVPGVERTG